MAGKIFISYRRDDSPGDARGVRDALATKFGKAKVFMDIDNLMVGLRFDQELKKALSSCDVLIAILGPRWLTILRERSAIGARDFVRDEIAAALKSNMIVIPVRVGREGGMPELPVADDLPEDIRELVMHQKYDVSHEHFRRDSGHLTYAITAARLSRQTFMQRLGALPSRHPWLTLILALVSIGVVVAKLPSPRATSVKVEDAKLMRPPMRPSAASAAVNDILSLREANQRAKEAAERAARDEEKIPVIRANAKEIYHGDSPVAGNPNGDVTLVVFFDPAEPFSIEGEREIKKMIAADTKLRVVYKIYPILGSEGVSRVMLAAHLQGKFMDVYNAMLKHKGRIDGYEAAALTFAEEIGLNMSRLKSDTNGEMVRAELQSTAALGRKLGLDGVPTFIANDRLVHGVSNMYILFKLITDCRIARCDSH